MDTTADPGQVNGSADDTTIPTSPYETDPSLIPKDDPYLARSAHYGRYGPRDDDFKPAYDRWYQSEPEAVSYWEEIVRKFCTDDNSLNVPGSREAFAVGSVIVRVDQGDADGASAERYSCINANELSSARKAEDALKENGVAVPIILFCGTIQGKNVTVESRIPGVSLEVAWRYLTAVQINALKQQCRLLMERLSTVDSPSYGPSYVCSGLNSQSRPDIHQRETEILFEEKGDHENLCLVHNDMVRPNIVVRDDRVVGIIGWRQSGFFGYDRAKKVHQELRIPEATFISSGGDEIGEPPWVDIYDSLSESTPDIADAEKGDDSAKIKTEPSPMGLDVYPANDEVESKKSLSQLDGGTETRPTPKQVTNLKRDSRASSTSDRESPAASAKPASAGKKGRGGSKKGAATKKPANRKRKTDDQNDDAVDSPRSKTPSSRTSKTPGPRKQGSASMTSSPAPEHKGKRSESAAAEDGDESYEDADEIFCICRRPDNHTWMIGCDGGCEDWFHGKCVNIDSKDAELIDRYICPNCKEHGKGCTTWKPMCRLASCRKPARAKIAKPSKYCSDEHGREFMRQHLDLASGMTSRKGTRNGAAGPNSKKAQEGLGSRGGILTIGELKAAVAGVSSAGEFRRLGNRIGSPPPETDSGGQEENAQNNDKLGLDVHPKDLAYSPDEASKLDKLRKRRDDAHRRKEVLDARNNFLGLVRQRAKGILEHLKQTDPKGGWKDICGFDSRLAWSDEEFDEWRFSEAGQKALKDGTPEALAASYPEPADADGDTAMDGADSGKNDLTRGVCTKKRCERHKQWVKVQQQDILFEENAVAQDLGKCETEARTVVERAVLRMWAEGENAHVNGE